MHLDVVIPTLNRAPLLTRTLESLLAARPAPGLELTVIVVDNGSTDDTRALVDAYKPCFANRLRYVYESSPGRSHALNAGIAVCTGDLVGMIDDDEEVDSKWLVTIAKEFSDPDIDFIGGPYVPRWGAPRPRWLGTEYRAAIGWVDSGEHRQRFGPGFDGMLMGGNAVIRREMLEKAGPFAVDLGRSHGTRLLSCEDRDMFTRLLDKGARGYYVPDLVILHYVPPDRLTRQYFRRWCFWHGVSLGVLDRRQPRTVPYVLGVPRYRIGAAVRGTIDAFRTSFGPGDPARIFAHELAWWELTGLFYGKHFYRAEPAAERPAAGPAAATADRMPSSLRNFSR
jgi:glycosyltransferase involved in cell wall biosynthesis